MILSEWVSVCVYKDALSSKAVQMKHTFRNYHVCFSLGYLVWEPVGPYQAMNYICKPVQNKKKVSLFKFNVLEVVWPLKKPAAN